MARINHGDGEEPLESFGDYSRMYVNHGDGEQLVFDDSDYEAQELPIEDGLVMRYSAETLGNHYNDGDEVRLWRDLVGTNNLVDAPDHEGPTYREDAFYGHPTTEWDVDEAYRLQATFDEVLRRPYTYVAVIEWVPPEDETDRSHGFILGRTDPDEGTYLAVRAHADRDRWRLYAGGTTSIPHEDHPGPIDHPYVVQGVVEGITNGILRVEDFEVKDSGATDDDQPGHALGNDAGMDSEGNFSGYIPEVLVYDRELDAPERDEIQYHLERKYDLPTL